MLIFMFINLFHSLYFYPFKFIYDKMYIRTYIVVVLNNSSLCKYIITNKKPLTPAQATYLENFLMRRSPTVNGLLRTIAAQKFTFIRKIFAWNCSQK